MTPKLGATFLAFCLMVLGLAPSVRAQGSATLTGRVLDPTGASVPEAQVEVRNLQTSVVYPGKTNSEGFYTIPALPPGIYRVAIQKPGFKTDVKSGIVLHVEDMVAINFSLQLGSASETVTVEAGAPMLNTTDGSVSTVVDQNYVKNMPLNGRSFQDLILLTPGVVTASPQVGPQALGSTGDFSVNGQRTEANYYTVDGVSANLGVSPLGPLPGNSGSLPAATALGTTHALVSLDALEEFRVQSSTYSAEYGRNPGGQFSFVTRSGTNQWHGSAFDYLRNNVFDANDWFNDYRHIPQAAERQNDFGGTLGGPIWKNKTFFFASYDGLRLAQPQEAVLDFVPSATLRNNAASALQPVLNAFPAPCAASSQGCVSDLGNGFGQFVGAWSNPGSIDSGSIRLDHALSDKIRLFFRFSDTSSTAEDRNQSVPSVARSNDFLTRTYTLGATSSISSKLSNAFRLNYSSNSSTFSSSPDSFGGATAANLFSLSGFTGSSKPDPFISVTLFFAGHVTPLQQFGFTGAQEQWNVVDTWSLSLGAHQLRFGIDYRRLNSGIQTASPTVTYLFRSAASLQTNSVTSGSATTQAPGFPLYSNFSAFGEDTWKVSQRLNLSFGLRWDVNPAPGTTQGVKPFTVQGSNPTTWTLAPQGSALWKTAWYNFAPRLGVAYALRNTPGRETVVRGGAGVFFDTGQQQGSDGYQGVGFSARRLFRSLPGSPVSFPISQAQANPVIVNPPSAPFTSSVFAFSPHLQLPYTLQWNASVQQALGKSQALTVSYVGANARRLLEQSEMDLSSLNPTFLGTVFFTRNGLTSDHNSLQVQYQRRFASGLQALASYTWAHTIDFGSFNASLPFLRGNSDFDVRHNFSGAFSYDLPNAFKNRFARAVLDNWGLDDRFTARSGFPVPLQGFFSTDPVTGQNFLAGLNLVPGQPVYIYGSQCATLYNNGLGCPGGRAINPAAFANPPLDPITGNPTRPGNAPRNFVRGFGAWQMDMAVRREFPIHERLKLQFRAEAFNIFNHPNFGFINSLTYCSLDSASPDFDPACTFGQASSTLANSVGGLSALYQMGGARSMQFALKLRF